VTKKSIITIARTAVAKVESTFCNPIFAKMETKAAKKAERTARRNHCIFNHPILEKGSAIINNCLIFELMFSQEFVGYTLLNLGMTIDTFSLKSSYSLPNSHALKIPLLS